MEGYEELGRPFRYELTLVTKDPDVDVARREVVPEAEVQERSDGRRDGPRPASPVMRAVVGTSRPHENARRRVRAPPFCVFSC